MPSSRLPAIFAALSAVGLWAATPNLVAIANVGEIELYSTSSLIALIVSLIVVGSRRSWWHPLRVAASRTWLFVAVSGSLLALWYIGFYRALEGPVKAEVSVIAFTWPIIALFAMRVQTRLAHWGCILLAFIGTALVALSGSGHHGGAAWSSYGWAMAAALGSGLYLPFGVRATRELHRAGLSSLGSTFVAVSAANAVSLVVSLTCATVGGGVHFAHSTNDLVAATIIGVGIYLVAEVSWTWAAARAAAQVAPLPYLTPIISIIALWICGYVHLRWQIVVGALLVVGANVGLSRIPAPHDAADAGHDAT